MAEKETNSTKNNAPKTTAKVTAKPAATSKPAATAAPKTTVTAKTTTTANPATSTAKPAATTAPKATVTAKPAATAKPATTVTAKPATTATAKPTVTAKPATTATAKPATTATAKPAATPVKTEAAATKPAPVEAKPKVAAAKVDEAETKPEKVKREKPAKPVKTGEGGGSSAKAKVAAIVKTDNFKIFGIIGLSLIMVLCLCLGVIFGVRSCTGMEAILAKNPVTVNAYANTTKVGYSSATVGTVQRNKPVEGVKNEGLSSGYPKYGSTLSLTTEQKTAIIAENRKLTANGTWVDSSGRTSGSYDKMDENGYLYKTDGTKPGNGVPEQLYKHTASVGLYGGNVSDDEPGIVKQVTLRPRGYSSYSVTGVYAPAGEVIKIQLSEADMAATGGITVHIGQALYNGQANNIWEQRGFNRMPVILNTMSVTKATATYDEATDTWTGYVGSFLGGPLYIRNTGANVKVTISGGVAYRHFILGHTTEAEFKELSKSTAPYFDLEVWEYGVLHSGPVSYAKAFSYNDLYKAAVLWEKVSIVSNENHSKQGIVFLYDPFVAAGAAVAFPGRSSVNCPLSWMSQSLNYSGMVTSGTWGNFHEYHHNFQNYGVSSGANGEVTNNGLNLVSYSLFTNISSLRQIPNYGGAGLSGWNQYTSATWALNRVNSKQITSTNGLAIYATLLHNFGQDQYIKARGTTNTNGYLNKWATNTHQDFTYYASQITDYGSGTYTPSEAVAAANYPLFVPISSVYQTGRTYMYDGEKREINTMQPYVIPAEQPFTVDLSPYTVNSANQYVSGSIVIGNGFSYKITGVKTDGINGTFVKSGEGEGIYTFTPNSQIRSGKIYVTIEITTTDGAHEWNGHKLDDVDLVLEFQQSREWNKSVLERTIYTYSADKMISDATEAFSQNFSGYESVKTVDHSNPTQNANTDIWYWPTTSGHEAYVETHPEYFATDNAIHVIDGKLYFKEDGKYRVYLRGRYNCAVYYSLDGKNYTLGARINDKSDSAGFRTNDPNTYLDIQFAEGKVTVWTYTGGDKTYEYTVKGDYWLYTKEILIAQTRIASSAKASYIGLGSAQWTVPQYTSKTTYYFMNGNTEVALTEETTEDGVKYYYGSGSDKTYVDNDKVKAKVSYFDGSGNPVSAEQASDVTPKAPTSASYTNAYRRSYEFQKQFESDYFYFRSYTYSYSYVETPSADAKILVTQNVDAYGDSPVQNLLTENGLPGTTGKFQVKSNKFPMEITVDLGQEITANRVDLYGTLYNGNSYHPTQFYILVGNSPEDISTPFGPHWENVKSTTGNTGFSIDESITFRYYKIVIEKWNYGAVQFRYIKFSNIIPGTAAMYSPDDKMFTYKGNWEVKNCNANFGHVYIGKNATVEFEINGTMLGIISSKLYGKNYEVYIDGELASPVYVKQENGDYALSYLSPKLEEGKHKVVVYCPEEANIDSIVVW
ncbi:MAG: M60 family metallopeptidase [Clostridia bacterium]|nr:M60 family metallopeptidase [Clostridia bacterium]